MAEIESAKSRENMLLRLMGEYEIPIRKMCCVYLRDEQLAADAVQETFLKAYLSLENFRGESSEKTWLMRIAVNVCHSMRRTGCAGRLRFYRTDIGYHAAAAKID